MLEAVLFIESFKDYVTIHLPEENHTVKYSLSAFHNLLDGRFLRVHRSYIVNVDKVTAYTKQDVEIDGKEIPIGDQYCASIQKHFQG